MVESNFKVVANLRKILQSIKVNKMRIRTNNEICAYRSKTSEGINIAEAVVNINDKLCTDCF